MRNYVSGTASDTILSLRNPGRFFWNSQNHDLNKHKPVNAMKNNFRAHKCKSTGIIRVNQSNIIRIVGEIQYGRILAIFTMISVSLLILPMIIPWTPLASIVEADPAEGNYEFTLEKEYVDIFIQRDGSIDIKYHFEFTNYGYLDGVDVGLPNRFYDEDSARATINISGTMYQPEKIHKSPYVYIGLAVEFDETTQYKVESYGTRFTLEFQVNNPHMVYKNELKDGTVGIRFRPTWFDPEFQLGNTDELRCRVFFPRGFNDTSQAVYLKGHVWDSIGWDNETGLLMASWTQYNVRPQDQEDGDYDVGVGFPKDYVEKYYDHNIWESMGNTWYFVRFHAASILVGCFMILLLLGMFVYPAISSRKRAKDYFEPKLCKAGGGPRKRLTAVEAAIILERPLNQVLTMILFNLIRNGKVEIVSKEEPMHLRKLDHFGDTKIETRFLHSIEKDLRTCATNEVGTLNRDGLEDLLVDLVEATEKKLKGFDYKATKKLYESVNKHAWLRVKAAGTPGEFAREFSKWSSWMMLDKKFPERMKKESQEYSYYEEPWYRWNAWYHPYHYRTNESMILDDTSVRFDRMMDDLVYNVKQANRHMVNDITDLGKEVTKVTNPVPVSSGGGSGGGCACACACACAGGGR